jgi:hypothetical protein
MIQLLPSILLFILFVSLFCREIKLDHKRRLEQKRLANEHFLREVEKFLKERATK